MQSYKGVKKKKKILQTILASQPRDSWPSALNKDMKKNVGDTTVFKNNLLNSEAKYDISIQ